MKKLLIIILCIFLYVPSISSSLNNKFVGVYSDIITVDYDLATVLPYVFKDDYKLENLDNMSKMSGIGHLNDEVGHIEIIYDTSMNIYFNGKILAKEDCYYILADAFTKLEPHVRYSKFIDDDFMLNRAGAYFVIAPGYDYHTDIGRVKVYRNKPVIEICDKNLHYIPMNKNNSVTLFMVDLDDKDDFEYVVIEYPKELTEDSKVKITAYDDENLRYLDSFVLDTPPIITINKYKPTATTKDYEIDLRVDNDYKFILPEGVKK